MAGIFGIIGPEADVGPERLSAMQGPLGQDGKADAAYGHAWAMGVQKLDSGLDDGTGLAWNEDETVCGVFVGELFGTSGLRAELRRKGHSFASSSQAELIVHLWEAYGAELITKANGLFAAAVWETERQRLTLLLDWIGGIRHLHYALLDGGIAFASEIRSLLAANICEVGLDQRALYQYLDFGHILPPDTLFKGISKLAPGCALIWENGSVQTQRVFKLRFEPEDGHNYVERFQEVFRQAIGYRLDGSKDVGAFLSGGIDSSFNVATMNALKEGPIKTFSITYPEQQFDESHYSRLVARHCNTDHYELMLDSAEVLNELPQMIWALEEPAMDYSFIPTFHLARFAKQHVDVAISGDGPDHLLGRHYPVAFAKKTLTNMPGMSMLAKLLLRDKAQSTGLAATLWRRLRRSKRGRFFWKALQSVTADHLQAYLSIYREIAYRDLLPCSPFAVVSDQIREDFAKCLDIAEPDNIEGDADDFNRILALDLAIDGGFGVFAKVGKMAAYHSLIVREPYLDLTVCTWLSKVPASLKVKGSTLDYLHKRARTKHILYEAAKGSVPGEVISKSKQGLQAPVGTWLRKWINNRDARAIFPALTQKHELLDEAFVNSVLGTHQSRQCDHGTLIMMLVTLDLWYGIFVEGGGQKPTWTWRDWLQQGQ